MCDAGLTSNKLLNFLLSEEIDFVCAISRGRVDQESGKKLKDSRVGEGTDKERVVVSNKGFSKKQFESYYCFVQ